MKQAAQNALKISGLVFVCLIIAASAAYIIVLRVKGNTAGLFGKNSLRQSQSCPTDSTGTVCANHGSCDSGVCDCDSNWTGAACDKAIVPCLVGSNGEVCSGHGTCYQGECNCALGYSGQTCENSVSLCPTNSLGVECGGHGTCLGPPSFVCDCDAGWEGSACQIPAACWTTSNGVCDGHGVCNADYTCTCNSGFYGVACTETQNKVCPGGCNGNGACIECPDGVCVGNPDPASIPNPVPCTNSSQACQCLCSSGYVGYACESSCPANPENGVICTSIGLDALKDHASSCDINRSTGAAQCTCWAPYGNGTAYCGGCSANYRQAAGVPGDANYTGVCVADCAGTVSADCPDGVLESICDANYGGPSGSGSQPTKVCNGLDGNGCGSGACQCGTNETGTSATECAWCQNPVVDNGNGTRSVVYDGQCRTLVGPKQYCEDPTKPCTVVVNGKPTSDPTLICGQTIAAQVQAIRTAFPCGKDENGNLSCTSAETGNAVDASFFEQFYTMQSWKEPVMGANGPGVFCNSANGNNFQTPCGTCRCEEGAGFDQVYDCWYCADKYAPDPYNATSYNPKYGMIGQTNPLTGIQNSTLFDPSLSGRANSGCSECVNDSCGCVGSAPCAVGMGVLQPTVRYLGSGEMVGADCQDSDWCADPKNLEQYPEFIDLCRLFQCVDMLSIGSIANAQQFEVPPGSTDCGCACFGRYYTDSAGTQHYTGGWHFHLDIEGQPVTTNRKCSPSMGDHCVDMLPGLPYAFGSSTIPDQQPDDWAMSEEAFSFVKRYYNSATDPDAGTMFPKVLQCGGNGVEYGPQAIFANGTTLTCDSSWEEFQANIGSGSGPGSDTSSGFKCVCKDGYDSDYGCVKCCGSNNPNCGNAGNWIVSQNVTNGSNGEFHPTGDRFCCDLPGSAGDRCPNNTETFGGVSAPTQNCGAGACNWDCHNNRPCVGDSSVSCGKCGGINIGLAALCSSADIFTYFTYMVGLPVTATPGFTVDCYKSRCRIPCHIELWGKDICTAWMDNESIHVGGSSGSCFKAISEAKKFGGKVVGWFSSCFLADSEILMADGTFGRIIDLKVGDMVMDADLNPTKVVLIDSDSADQISRSNSEVHELLLDGKPTGATPTHPMLMEDGRLAAFKSNIIRDYRLNGFEMDETTIYKDYYGNDVGVRSMRVLDPQPIFSPVTESRSMIVNGRAWGCEFPDLSQMWMETTLLIPALERLIANQPLIELAEMYRKDVVSMQAISFTSPAFGELIRTPEAVKRRQILVDGDVSNGTDLDRAAAVNGIIGDADQVAAKLGLEQAYDIISRSQRMGHGSFRVLKWAFFALLRPASLFVQTCANKADFDSGCLSFASLVSLMEFPFSSAEMAIVNFDMLMQDET